MPALPTQRGSGFGVNFGSNMNAAPSQPSAAAPQSSSAVPQPAKAPNPSLSALDDIAASAARLIAHQRSAESSALDAIPHLARPLSQLRRDTDACSSAFQSPAPGAFHARAVRLLASAPDFEPDRLRRAVETFGHAPQNPSLSWLDDNTFLPRDDMSVATLQARHHDSIVARAADHLRLDASMSFRAAYRDSMHRDLASSRVALTGALTGAVDPSAAIPSPFLFQTPEKSRPVQDGSASASAARSRASPGASPGLPVGASRPPKSGGRSAGRVDASRSSSAVRGAGQPRPSSSAIKQSPARSRPGTLNPRSVATVSPDAPFVSTMRDHVLDQDTPAEVAGLLMEQAQDRGDHPHFIACLSILAELCDLSAAAPDGKTLTQHHLICNARSKLEDLFASCIGGVPLDRKRRSPQEVRQGVHAYVSDLVSSGRLLTSPELASSDRRASTGLQTVDQQAYVDNLPFWPQFYYCLRCGSLKAAQMLANEAHEDLDNGAHFRFFMYDFIFQNQPRTLSEEQDGDEDKQGDPMICPGDYAMSRNIPGALKDVAKHNAFADEYGVHPYNGTDPYRRAVYILLARLEIQSPTGSVAGNAPNGSAPTPSSGRHRKDSSYQASGQNDAARYLLPFRDEDYGLLFDSLEDYYWLRLWLCRSEREVLPVSPGPERNSPSVPIGPVVTFEQVQSEVLGLGHSYFDSEGQHSLLYAFVLVATGLPWQAVEYLASLQSPVMSAYAAYLALPMYVMGWAPSEAAYATVVWAHVIHFACDHPKDAALCLFAVRDRSALRTCLQRLVMDTGSFLDLLGDGKEKCGILEDIAIDIAKSGSSRARESGMDDCDDVGIVQFIQDLKKEIASSLADEFSKSSGEDVATIALLCAICGDEKREREAILSNLANMVAMKEGYVARDRAIAAARSSKRAGSFRELSRSMQQSFTDLLHMADFFDDYSAGHLRQAWSKLYRTGLLPLEKDKIHDRQLAFTLSHNHYLPAVIERLPDLLRAALDIAERSLLGEAGDVMNLPDRPICDSGPHVSQVVVLSTFAGIMGFSESEINGRLVRLELLLST